MTLSVSAFQDSFKNLSDKELAGLAATSPAIHFSTFVKIYNKDNLLIRPKPNILQLRMSQVYEQCMSWGIPCRMIVCKPRQVGCSTFSAHIVYHHEMRHKTDGLTVADVADNSKKLMKKVADYAMRDSFPWGNKVRPLQARLEFSNGSEHEIDSAENWKAGISRTRQVFHASEVGKWPKSGVKQDTRVMASILPSVPKSPRTVVIAEGTPEGAVGWMYETWAGSNKDSGYAATTVDQLAALREEGSAPPLVWIKVFAAWFEFEEHQNDGREGRPAMTPGEKRAIEKTLTERERRGISLYGWTMEQIAWRRGILSTECGGNEDLLDEYYPEDDHSCWLVSGRPRFSLTAITTMERMTKSMKPEIGTITLQENKTVQWSPSQEGDVHIWELPKENCRYLVACDPMTGSDQTTGGDPDRHSVGVIRQGYYNPDNKEDVKPALAARVRAPYIADADQVAGQIIGLQRMYGNCIVVLEVNMGLGVLELLKFEGVPLLYRDVLSARLGHKVRQAGWKLSNRDERRHVIDALATAIRELGFIIPCPHALLEAKNFITSTSGRDEARPGAHDDDIFMLAMGYISLASATEYRGERRRRREPADRKKWQKLGEHHV